VIENEFGEVGIDDELLKNNTKMQADEKIIEMMNGCICCKARGDLIEAVGKLEKFKIENHKRKIGPKTQKSLFKLPKCVFK